AQRSMPYRALFAIEWCGMIGAILALGPNTQDRHLLLMAFPATLAISLVYVAGSRIPVRTLIAGITILIVGVMLPFDILGRSFTIMWRSTGAPGWCALVSCGLIMWWAINYMR